MTIERQDFHIEYPITGEDAERTAFPFLFPVKEAEHIFCYDFPSDDEREGVEAIPRSDYAVSPAASGLDGGGVVTLAAPLGVGHVLRIERMTGMTQEKVFANQDRIPPEEVEDGLDRLTMIAQEQRGKVVEFDSGVSMAGANAAAALNAASRAAADAAGATVTANQALVKAEEALDAAEGGGGGYDLPIATASTLGGIKPDGTTLVVDPSTGVASALGGGEGGTSDHRALSNRDAADSHPQSAITGLTAALAAKAAASDVTALAATVAGKANASDLGGLAYEDDAPQDGDQYVRQNGGWVANAGGGQAFPLIVGEARQYFGAVADKTAFEPNFLYADGRAVSRTAYPELFAAYGVLYGAGNGSTTFNLPDLRGVFVRGLDEGRGLDGGRTLGVLQMDAIRNITGEFVLQGANGVTVGISTGHNPGWTTGAFKLGGAVGNYCPQGFVAESRSIAFDASGSVPTASENRPVNMPAHWFIVAQSPAVASSSDFTAAVNAVNASMGTIRAEVGSLTRLVVTASQTIVAAKTGWMWLYPTGGGGGGGSSNLYAAGGGGGATVPCLVSVNAGDSIAITIGAGGSLGAGGGQTAVTINGVTYTAGGGGGGGNSTASLWGGGGGGGGIGGTGGSASSNNGGGGNGMDNGGSGSGTYAGAPGGGGFNCGGGVQHVNRGGSNGAGGWAMSMHGTSAKYGFGGNGYAAGNPGCVVLIY